MMKLSNKSSHVDLKSLAVMSVAVLAIMISGCEEKSGAIGVEENDVRVMSDADMEAYNREAAESR